MKYIGWIIGGLAGLVVLTAVAVWIGGAFIINKKYETPESKLVHTDDPAVIEHGKRIATITGCNGCHGVNMQGGVFAEMPDGTRVVAANLPRTAAAYSDEELARSIRYGVRKDRSGLIIMPSDAFFAMNDDDLIAVMSYIYATPDEGETLPSTRVGLLPRFFILKGDFKTAPSSIGDMNNRPEFNLADKIETGAYLARIACSECHGLDYKGITFGDFSSPDLMVAAAYAPEQFYTLMKTGVGAGARDLGLMSEISKNRFSAFENEEIDALHSFLVQRASATPD